MSDEVDKPEEEKPEITEPFYEEMSFEELMTVVQETKAAAEKYESEAKAMQDKAVRAQAELENTRKRSRRDVEDAHRYVLGKFLPELFPIIDSLEQAVAAGENGESAGVREGVELTLKMFTDVLAKFNVQVISPENQAFDPQFHEVMTMQPSQEKAGTVLQVIQKGYLLHDRLIRPARVIVAKELDEG